MKKQKTKPLGVKIAEKRKKEQKIQKTSKQQQQQLH
jgi:hypothetical protein